MTSAPARRAEAYRLLVADVYELAGASRRTSEALARAEDSTVARWHLLSVLSDGPRTVASAARRLGLARQSVQRVADELLASGHLSRAANPADARADLLSPTASGRRLLRRLVAATDDDRGRRLAAAGVTATELRAARDVVRRLTAALTDPGEEPTT